MTNRIVVGVDAWKGRWVAVTLLNGHFHAAALLASIAELRRMDDAVAIGIDMPIGLPNLGGTRKADIEARAILGRRWSSVFMTPSDAEFDAETHAAAVIVAREAGHPAMSAQAWGLRQSIRDVSAVAATDQRIYEVHPEVSFAAMGDEPPRWAKASWNGVALRLALLRAQGIALPEQIEEAGIAGVADVLDAAAAAWSADRIAQGAARSFPDPPETIGGRSIAIWA